MWPQLELSFFGGDRFTGHATAHVETSSGGIASLQGDNQLFLTAMDPTNFTSGGVIRLSTITGEQPSAGTQIYVGPNNSGNFGKATGMGDIELLSDPAPIEIGNLVWEDTDQDGVQDGGESGISGVVVKLYKADATTLIGTATTDASGHYIFSNDPNGAAPSAGDSHIYQITMLMPGQEYIVRIEDISDAGLQPALASVTLGTPNNGEGANTDINDSDGVDNGGGGAEVTVLITDIPKSGANNHSFDFAFLGCPPARCGTVTVVKN